MHFSAFLLSALPLLVAAQRGTNRAITSLQNVKLTDSIPVSIDTASTPAGALFNDKDIGVAYVANKVGIIKKRSSKLSRFTQKRTEPDPDRPVQIPDPYLVFVVQCTDAGFRGDCLVFGSKPGDCVSYFDFQGKNETIVSDTYNDKVTSLSTNTGGVCQFYNFVGCDNKLDDRGFTTSYEFDMSTPKPGQNTTDGRDNMITSWRC